MPNILIYPSLRANHAISTGVRLRIRVCGDCGRLGPQAVEEDSLYSCGGSRRLHTLEAVRGLMERQ